METLLLVCQTGEFMGIRSMYQFRPPVLALLGSIIATGCKGAALGKIGRVRHKALYRLEHGRTILYIGQRVEQALGVRVQGMIEHVLKGALLHYAASVHYRHGITYLGDYSQIVGYHYHGGIVLFLQLIHELQHLSLNGNVKGSCGLVGYKQLRIAGQSDGYYYALLHAA